MSSDADYAAFLDKANQDVSGGGDVKSSSTDSKSYKSKAVNTQVPQGLADVDVYYVSDADEPFEAVSLKWDGAGDGELDAKSFATLISHKGEVEELSTKDFDPKGQYKEVTSAVEKASGGKAKIFRVDKGRSRVEYFVVGVDKKDGKVVGLRALAVES